MLLLHGKNCSMGSTVPEFSVISSDTRSGVGAVILFGHVRLLRKGRLVHLQESANLCEAFYSRFYWSFCSCR